MKTLKTLLLITKITLHLPENPTNETRKITLKPQNQERIMFGSRHWLQNYTGKYLFIFLIF